MRGENKVTDVVQLYFPLPLRKEMDDAWPLHNYKSRSEFVREAVRRLLIELKKETTS